MSKNSQIFRVDEVELELIREKMAAANIINTVISQQTQSGIKPKFANGRNSVILFDLACNILRLYANSI